MFVSLSEMFAFSVLLPLHPAVPSSRSFCFVLSGGSG
jgi:hypothetical protein